MKKINKVAGAFLALAAFIAPCVARAAAGGDIYEILPVDENGASIEAPAKPLVGGDVARFAVRLMKPTLSSAQFRLVHQGLNIEAVDWIANRPAIGVYVNGGFTLAYLEKVNARSDIFTDLIFSYTVKPGDFALPMRLADSNKNMVNDASNEPAGPYYLNFLDSSLGLPAWRVDNSTETTVADREANFFYGSTRYSISSPDFGARRSDYDLSRCNFMIKAVDFDSNDESADCWRSVHEHSTAAQPVGPIPSIVVNGMPTNSLTLYVWSENPEAVELIEGRDVVNVSTEVVQISQSSTAQRRIGEIKIVAGKQKYEFNLRGVAATNDATIVMSAFKGFNYSDGTGERLQDYVTRTVKCIGPQPASVTIAPQSDIVTATSDYGVYVTTLGVSFSENPLDHAIEAEIVPEFTDTTCTNNWWEYIRISASAAADPTLVTPAGNPILVFNAGSTVPSQIKIPLADGTTSMANILDGKLYIYALRSDAHVTGSKKLSFMVKTLDSEALKPSAEGGIDGWNEAQSSLTINGSDPVIVSMFGGEKSVSAVAGSARTLEIEISDLFADMTIDNASTNKGYQIWIQKNSDSDKKFTQLPGLYYPGKGNVLFKNGTTDTLPEVVYTEPVTNKSVIYVVSPISGNQSANYKFDVAVSTPAGFTVVTTDGEEEYNEGDVVQVNITLDKQNTAGDIYAFIKGETDEATAAIDCTWKAAAGGKGRRLAEYATSLSSGCKFTLLDGSTAGSDFAYEIVFLNQSDWTDDDNAKVTAYKQKGSLVLQVYNVIPKVDTITLGRYDVSENGATVGGSTNPAKFPMGITNEFSIVVDEPGGLDKTSTNEPFKVRWVFTDEQGITYSPTEPTNEVTQMSGVVEGNPDEMTCKFDFPAPGKWTVEVDLQEKDMTKFGNGVAGEKFTFYVNVIDQPAIQVETAANDSYYEQSSVEFGGDAALTIKLDINNCTFDFWVNLLIEPNAANGTGTFALQESDDVVKLADGSYNVKIPRRTTERTVYVYSMDGTQDSRTTGFRITPSVATNDGYVVNNFVPNSGNKKVGDYYVGVTKMRVLVINDKPLINPDFDINPIPGTNAIPSSIGAADEAITWSFNDVDLDFARGITVEFKGGGGWGPNTYTNKADAIAAGAQGFIPTFKDSGLQTVKLIVKDQDGGSESITWEYIVETAKSLTLVAHGPGSGQVAKYDSASGIGKGRVWAPSKSEIAVDAFASMINAGKAASINIFGYGYKVGDQDDGVNLHAPDGFGGYTLGYNVTRDTPINASGKNKADGAAFIYDAPTDARGNKVDSFLYTWMVLSSDAEGGTLSFQMMNNTTAPEYVAVSGDSGKTIQLPTEFTEEGNYVDTYAEAIFSIEYLASDNMGDINLDGIPDVYVNKYAFGGAVDGEAAQASGSDLKNINKENTDEDYLPSFETSAFGTLIPGLADSWVTHGQPFTAKLEIRGNGESMNDAPENNAFTRVANLRPDRVYTDPLTDPKSTLDGMDGGLPVEYLAWLDFAAVNGINPADTNSWSKWSPERPTDPTVDDTDGDGFPDGYEYFIWYRAHVGYNDGGKHTYLTGRRYDPKNPGSGKYISSAEIAAAFDPAVANAAFSETQDTDNDGLPDLIEFAVGTNPYDFDTDGDGLPDGYELMLTGTSPVLAYTTVGISDAMRNFDGDAMAYTSPTNEASDIVLPKPYKVQSISTFALVDENGDTDGIQWYAIPTTEAPTTNIVYTEDAEGYILKISGGEYITKVMPTVVTNSYGVRLAGALDSKYTWRAGVNPADSNQIVRLRPVRIPAGTILDEVPDTSAKTAYGILSFDKDIADTLTAWVYGRRVDTLSTGESIANRGGFGFLALGRYKDAPSGMAIAVLPRVDNNVGYLHHMVYQEFGFDPRTAWNANTPLGARWGTTVTDDDGSESSKVNNYNVGFQFAGISTRTREYTLYDEFLVLSFFLNSGAAMDVIPTVNNPWHKIWSQYTTNGRGPGESDLVTEGDNFVGRADTEGTQAENGADTDGDGVPDGWELYVMSGPKRYDKDTKKFYFRFPSPYYHKPFSSFGPFEAEAGNMSLTDNAATGGYEVGAGDADGLTERGEFGGTDTALYYADYSETIKRPEDQESWLNKYFPTDPWQGDTDGDGISDSGEKSSFAYGTPADNGKLVTIPGGGLNPLSVDTDFDGLPDGWESEFKGSTPYKGDDANYATFKEGGESASKGNPLEGLIDGMDGTVPDAYNMVNGSGGGSSMATWTMTRSDGSMMFGKVNRDYDNDGLENWQEYLVGTMRCWRYDDPWTQWNGIPESLYWDPWGNFAPDYEAINEMFGAGTIKTTAEDGGESEFWYKTLVLKDSPIYNPRLISGQTTGAQYFSRVTNGWDLAYLPDTAGGAYYYFKDRVGDTKLEDLWVKPYLEKTKKVGEFLTAPRKYISCSPIAYDTDRDGMDDFYELFHGMNPLLGGASILLDNQGPCDIVYDAWTSPGSYPIFEPWGDDDANMWLFKVMTGQFYKTGAEPRGTGYDFEYFPWLNGLASADPDGDDIRNQAEAIMPKLAGSAWLHTDPTPLWMTDTSYERSLIRLFFRMPGRDKYVPTPGDSFTYDGVTYNFSDFGGWAPAVPLKLPERFVECKQDNWWGLYGIGASNWIASFEENEGYDTDQDALSDFEESVGELRAASDPQEANSPNRRQAMYFQGPEKPSALQLPVPVAELHPIAGEGYPDEMTFFKFTVECWAKAESLADATLVERAIYTDPSKAGDEERVRKNFQLGIKNGKWYAKFDANGTLVSSVAELLSNGDVEVGVWYHIAATFDGSTFSLYVNGAEAATPKTTSILPEYGSSAVVVYRDSNGYRGVGDYWFDHSYSLKTIVVGASLKTVSEGGSPFAFDVENAYGWMGYNRFFKGYIDEIRIWDGARTSAEIRADVETRTRYTRENALANRLSFYKDWTSKGNRYQKDENGEDKVITPELVYHFSFDSVPGGVDETIVAKGPTGFDYYQPATSSTTERGAAVLSRPQDWNVAWWASIMKGYGSVYSSDKWVQWVPNTVAHLPRFDGTTLDSFFWSDNTCGSTNSTQNFAHTAEPVSRWVQMFYNENVSSAFYEAPGFRHHLICTLDGLQATGSTNTTENWTTSRFNMFQFTGRHAHQNGDNLLPLGGAYAKSAPNMWDSFGASTAWEVTSDDSDANNLPDTWEQYAMANYNPSGDPLTWTTLVEWKRNPTDKVTYTIIAGEAFLRDLALGRVPGENADGDIDILERPDLVQTADEDFSRTPDWWDDLYGVFKLGGTTDVDNDGLSNYAEYLISECFPFGFILNPKMPKTDTKTLDYFLKIGSLYIGEMFTDHDFMEDWYERGLNDDTVDVNQWDARRDGDEDGWSNIQETRYNAWCISTLAKYISHAVGDTSVLDMPQPAIKITARYNGSRDLTKAGSENAEGGSSQEGNGGEGAASSPVLRVITYSDSSMVKPDAEFSVQPGATVSSEFYIGGWEERIVRGTLQPGNIEYGTFDIWYAQLPQDDMYSWIDESGTLHYSRPYSEFKAALEQNPNIIQNVISFSWNHLLPASYNGATAEKAITVTSGGNIAVYGERVGKIDLVTGDFEFDMGAMAKLSFSGFFTTSPENAWGVKEALFKFTYTAKVPDTQYYKVAASLSKPDKGFVKGGKNSIFAYWDLGGDGQFTPGTDPCGVVRDFEMGWRENVIDIELTDTSAITPRTKLWEASSSDRIARFSEAHVATNKFVAVDPAAIPNTTRMRVVRYAVDGLANHEVGFKARVLLDRKVEKDVRDFLHEGDFLSANEFDIDWTTFADEVYNDRAVIRAGCDVTNMTYIVVVGDGDIEYFSSEDNHHTVNALPYVLTRRFEVERTAPTSVIEDGDSVCKVARPTFRWRIDGEDKWASAFGTTYTAFKVKVWNEGGDLVYDSGYQRMPAADSKGVYNWTAPLYVDSSSSSGSHQVFSNLCNYTWQVFTYNSKFKTDEAGSQKRTFRMNVTEIDQSSYSLAVNVAYAGPGKNLAGLIRVQAFTSPDFSGYPACEAVVADVTSKALDASAGSKVVLKGLKPGKYFLRAYIDTDGDFVLDDWESWGYLSERDYAAVVGTKNIFNLAPVTIGAEILDPQVRQLFIEDADTDGDGFPDIWEAEQNGGAFDPEVVVPVTGDAELIAVNTNLLSNLDKATQGFIATTVQALSTPSGLSMISGVPLAVAKAVFSSGTVPAKVVGDSVNITSMSIDTNSREVVLGVSAETAADKFDSTIASLYALKVPNGATVTVKVYRTPNLAEDWTLASTQTVVISLAGTEIRAPLADDVDLKSGFFKVEVE